MKTRTLKSLIVGSTLGLSVFATQSMAATTGTVLITGTVQAVLSIAVTANSNSFTITPGTAVTSQNIATIDVDSNNPAGYDVTLAGTHASSVLQDSGTNTIAYTVSYNGGSAQGMTTTAANVENSTSVTSGAISRSLTLDIAAADSVGKPATVGGYTDTITATITAK